jgi:hypothetical protein
VEPCIESEDISRSCDADGEDGIDCATERKKSSMYWRDAGSYYENISTIKTKYCLARLTSTGYTSLSWKPFICPSGSKPLGKSDRRTNSGKVNSSSRERVNRVPLYLVSIEHY